MVLNRIKITEHEWLKLTTQNEREKMNYFLSPSLAALTLRIALGAMWLSHSIILKLLTFGFAGFTGFMVSQGFPSFLALPVVAAEIVGGILIIVGCYGRWVSIALLPILFGAIWIHSGNGWVFTAPNGGWEYPAFLVLASLAHFFIGDGELAIRTSFNRPGSIAEQNSALSTGAAR